jgi:hypothetical protein
MKFYQQEGTKLNRTQLHQSDHICECCQEYNHSAHTFLHDDAECQRCGQLCCCDCHRDPRTAPKPQQEEETE